MPMPQPLPPDLDAAQRDARRRRRELIAAAIIAVVLALLLWGESVFVDFTGELGQGNLLFFALINVNVILACVLLFLIFRNLTKLLFERRRKVLGARLRTRLVVAFVAFALVPTFVLFYVSMTFISNSVERWFSLQIENSLSEAMQIAQSFYDVTENRARGHATAIAGELAGGAELGAWMNATDPAVKTEATDALLDFLEQRRRLLIVEAIELFIDPTATPLLVRAEENKKLKWRPSPADFLAKAFSGHVDSRVDPFGGGEIARGAAPVPVAAGGKHEAVLVVSFAIPETLLQKMTVIQKTYDQYRQLRLLRSPIRTNYLVYLGLISMFIFFSATWFGFYLARQITEPLQRLAEGAGAVAAGEMDVRIEKVGDDEIGTLVEAFNRMLDDLSTSRQALETTMANLEASNVELERRRASMAAVLANVAAGVVAFDHEGRATSVNPSAERILGVRAADVIGKAPGDAFPAHLREAFGGFTDELRLRGRGTVQGQVEVLIGDELRTLLVVFSVIESAPDGPSGAVLVAEDLTELLRAQRVAAWQEIARRIAHEIKNPLTPIQLAAQRLRKRYSERFDPVADKVFFDSTGVIIRQVEEMKSMVGEFSSFARMAEARPSEADIGAIVEEAITLFRAAHKKIVFAGDVAPDIPQLLLDRGQIKRALINVIDNAIAATAGRGHITVAAALAADGDRLVLKISDDGRGLPDTYRGRLFEPYFSTKKMGTGLGLAIVYRIIHDHGGTISMRDNQPRGTVVVIELPVKEA